MKTIINKHDDRLVHGIDYACQLNGIKKKDLASMIGVTQSDISNWKNRSIPKKKIGQLERLLGIEGTYLNKLLSKEEQELLSAEKTLTLLYKDVVEDVVTRTDPNTGEEYEIMHGEIDLYRIQHEEYEVAKNALLISIIKLLDSSKTTDDTGLIYVHKAIEKAEVIQKVVQMLDVFPAYFYIVEQTISAMNVALLEQENQAFGEELFEDILSAVVKARNTINNKKLKNCKGESGNE